MDRQSTRGRDPRRSSPSSDATTETAVGKTTLADGLPPTNDDPIELGPPAHRWTAPTAFVDEGTARAHGLVQFDAASGQAMEDPDQVHQLAAAGTGGVGSLLPHLAAIQRAFGHHDLGGVMAHVGGEATTAANAMNANAFATGNHVAFAREPDLRLAAHEAAHVIQQRGGVRLSSGVGAVGDVYERHADAVADRVVRGESAVDLLDQHANLGAPGGNAVQRQEPGEQEAGDDTADQIPQEPDPTPVIDRFRGLLERIARDQDVDMPGAAMNQLVQDIQTMIQRNRLGALPEQRERAESNVLSYRWELRGSVSHGPPRRARAHRSQGTARQGLTDDISTEDVNERSRGSSSRDQLSGSGGQAAGDSGGREFSGSAEHEGADQRASRAQNTNRRGAQRVEGTEAEIPLQTIGYEVDVMLNLEASLVHERMGDEIEGEGSDTSNTVFGGIARAFDTDSTRPRTTSTGGVIGQITRHHQGAAPEQAAEPPPPPQRRAARRREAE